MGVFKQLAAVPDEYRLEQYADAYAGRDVWQTYVDAHAEMFDSDRYRATFRKAGQSWTDHMADRGRHHALARPQDVMTWSATLVAGRTRMTAYSEYFVRVEEFYMWLQFHTEFPHVYHPVLMAVATDDLTRSIWTEKFDGLESGGDDG